MAVDLTKVKLGVCDVTFNSIDLGATIGGVEVEISTTTYQLKVDQTGETPAKDIITGTTVTVKVPMAEHDLDRLLDIIPQATEIGTGSTDGVMIGTGVNVDLFTVGHELVLHPTGVSGSDKSQDFGLYKAAPVPNYSFKYQTNEVRVFEVTFTGYPVADAAASGGYKLAWFGDKAAT